MKRTPPKHRPSTVHYNASEFRELHGFMPRGQACWGFYFSDAPTVQWRAFEVPSSYQAAKLLATREAHQRGVSSVRVEPNPDGLRLSDE